MMIVAFRWRRTFLAPSSSSPCTHFRHIARRSGVTLLMFGSSAALSALA